MTSVALGHTSIRANNKTIWCLTMEVETIDENQKQQTQTILVPQSILDNLKGEIGRISLRLAVFNEYGESNIN